MAKAKKTTKAKNPGDAKRMWVVVLLVTLIVAGGGVILYILSQDEDKVLNPGAYYGNTADGFSANVDKDKHIGAIDVLTTEKIAAAFGDGVTVGEQKQSGTVRLGTTNTETASATVTSESGEVVFDVDARLYESSRDVRRANVFSGAEKEQVPDVGDAAHYLFPFTQQYAKEQQAILLVRSGNVVYRFAITQSSDAIIYDEAQSRKILLNAAKSANLDAVK